jgi:wobble nucleotide-excising tRNase
MNLQALKAKTDFLISEKAKKEDKLSKIVERIKKIEEESVEIDTCIEIFDFLTKSNHDKVIGLLEDVVSSGLKDLFDETYNFRILQKMRGNATACDFELSCSAFPGWSDIILCHGKSIQDLVSAILRLVLIKLDGRSRKVFILDEPTSGVESERQTLVSKFLLDISEKFGIQFIVVTHSKELAEGATKEIRIG